jgi:hypothetical protein
MSIPHIFESGDIASSAEVNENFDHLSDIVGNSSDSSELALPGSIMIGPRANVQITAESDTAYGDDSYVQIGWNTELYFSGGVWNVRRFNADEVANALRVGRYGLEFYGTSNISGSLNSRLNKMFGVRAVSGSDRVFIKSDVHIQGFDDAPNSLSDYRLTYVPFDNPVALYEGVVIHKATKNRVAANWSVPEHAVAIQMVAYVRANSTDNNCRLTLMRAEAEPTIGSGFGVVVQADHEAYGEGIVHLGTEGTNLGRFLEVRSHNFAEASLFVKGYWT